METIMFEREENGNSKDGWYKHKDTGAVIELNVDPTLGSSMIDGFVQVGFVYVGKENPIKPEVAPLYVKDKK